MNDLEPEDDFIDEGAPPELSALFAAAKEDTLSEARVERALANANVKASPAKGSLTAKAAGLALTGMAIWASLHFAQAPTSTPVEPLPHAVIETVESPPSVAPLPIEEVPPHVETPAPEVMHSTPSARPSARVREVERAVEAAPVIAPDVVVETDEVAEGTLLLRARRSVNPAQMLTLAEEHATRFPEGRLAMERERIAIDALLQLEHPDAARARAERFIARWPSSPHRGAVEAALAAPQ